MGNVVTRDSPMTPAPGPMPPPFRFVLASPCVFIFCGCGGFVSSRPEPPVAFILVFLLVIAVLAIKPIISNLGEGEGVRGERERDRCREDRVVR